VDAHAVPPARGKNPAGPPIPPSSRPDGSRTTDFPARPAVARERAGSVGPGGGGWSSETASSSTAGTADSQICPGMQQPGCAELTVIHRWHGVAIVAVVRRGELLSARARDRRGSPSLGFSGPGGLGVAEKVAFVCSRGRPTQPSCPSGLVAREAVRVERFGPHVARCCGCGGFTSGVAQRPHDDGSWHAVRSFSRSNHRR
jgi:hypothetical protein